MHPQLWSAILYDTTSYKKIYQKLWQQDSLAKMTSQSVENR